MNVIETPEKSAATKPLVVVSSRTGNTRTVAYAVRDALPGAELVAAEAMPESLSQYDPVILGFWCDCGRAPADMKRAAAKLAGKRVACFATLGGEPDTPRAKDWMMRTSSDLIGGDRGNVLAGTFLCRGCIDPKLSQSMPVTPERAQRWSAAETHPNRMDLIAAAAYFAERFARSTSGSATETA